MLSKEGYTVSQIFVALAILFLRMIIFPNSPIALLHIALFNKPLNISGSADQPISWAEKNKQRKEKEGKPVNEPQEGDTSLKKKKKKKKEKKEDKDIKQHMLKQYKDDPGFADFLQSHEKGLSKDESSVAHDSGSRSVRDENLDTKSEAEDNDSDAKIALETNVSNFDVRKSAFGVLCLA